MNDAIKKLPGDLKEVAEIIDLNNTLALPFKTMKWTEGLKADDLPGDLQLVARECGIDVAIILAEKMGSIGIYIRPIEGLIAKKKEEYIFKHFDGNNHKELAIATSYSERWIYIILDRRREAKEKQQELFNDENTANP